jgi:NitT/TauT family transport system substrate-binding protein
MKITAMKKSVLIALSAVLMVLAIALFRPKSPEQPETPKTSGRTLTLCRYYWPGNFWIEIAWKKGWFDAAGLKVDLIDTNTDYHKFIEDMVAGKMDANNFTLFDMIHFISRGADLVAVIKTDESYGADAIVARKGIEKIADLRGKTIGVKINSYLEYILNVAMERGGLTLEDVILKDVAAESAVEALIDQKVDAMTIWEPIVGEAVLKGLGTKLFDTSQFPGISPSVLVFHRRVLNERPEDVAACVRVWNRAVRFILENPQSAYDIIADIYQVPASDVAQLAQVDRISDHRENIQAFSYAAGMDSLHGASLRIHKFLLRKGLATGKLNSAAFLDDRFVVALTER